MFAALQLAAFLILPVILNGLAGRLKLGQWLSPVILCYAVGVAAGNLGLPLEPKVTGPVVIASVLLAIPLLIISADFMRWLRLARRTALACALSFSVMVLVTCASAPLFMGRVEDGWIVAGMLVGTYTGSAPNMAAVSQALGAADETLVLLTTTDLVVAGSFCFVLLSPAVKLVGNFLPAFPTPDAGEDGRPDDAKAPPRTARAWALSMLAGVVMVGVAGGLSLLFEERAQQLVAILTVTTLGIAGSFVRPLRALPTSYPLGDYFILVFCLSFGTLANFEQLVSSASSGAMLAWTATVLCSGVSLHLILCRLLKIDRDTALITLTAAIYGPPFIGPVAVNLRNPEVVLSGLTAALAGLAVGNYLGVAVAWFTQWTCG